MHVYITYTNDVLIEVRFLLPISVTVKLLNVTSSYQSNVIITLNINKTDDLVSSGGVLFD